MASIFDTDFTREIIPRKQSRQVNTVAYVEWDKLYPEEFGDVLEFDTCDDVLWKGGQGTRIRVSLVDPEDLLSCLQDEANEGRIPRTPDNERGLEILVDNLLGAGEAGLMVQV